MTAPLVIFCDYKTALIIDGLTNEDIHEHKLYTSTVTQRFRRLQKKKISVQTKYHSQRQKNSRCECTQQFHTNRDEISAKVWKLFQRQDPNNHENKAPRLQRKQRRSDQWENGRNGENCCCFFFCYRQLPLMFVIALERIENSQILKSDRQTVCLRNKRRRVRTKEKNYVLSRL